MPRSAGAISTGGWHLAAQPIIAQFASSNSSSNSNSKVVRGHFEKNLARAVMP